MDLDKIKQYDNPPRDGACKGHDPKMWYAHTPRNEPGKYASQIREAKEGTKAAKLICKGCNVRYECLGYALYYESFGVWGGATERERIAIRRLLDIKMIVREPFLVARAEQKTEIDE